MTHTGQYQQRAVKRKFILGGVATGVLLGAGYLALNVAGVSLLGSPTTPDPIGVRFVNVFLIFAACILQASILGRVAGWLVERHKGRG